MNDTELYRQILGLEKPWGVERVVLDVEQGRVDVFVQHEASWRWACPECERELPCFDHSEERVWPPPGYLPVSHAAPCSDSSSPLPRA